MTGKICSHCDQEKPISEFFRDRSRPDGLHSYCKSCHKITYSPEKKRKATVRYQANHPEWWTAYTKNYYEKTKEEQGAYAREYYKTHRAERLQKMAEYRRSERGRALSCERTNRRKRMIEQATPKWADLSKTQLIYQQAAEITSKTGIFHTVDHIIPITSKIVCGLHWHGNLQILSKEANRLKSNKVLGE